MYRNHSSPAPVTVPLPVQSRRRSRYWRQTAIDLLFLAPALIVFSIFFIYPVLSSFYYSLTDWNGLDPQTSFVGAKNFNKLVGDAKVWNALRHTLVYALFVTVLQNSIGLVLALALDGAARVLPVLRVVFLIPMLLSSLTVAYVWNYLYAPNFGFINTALQAIGLEQWGQNWLGDPQLALPSLIATHTWQWVGFSTIIYLAGLQAVPTELREAASIDGANSWQRFWGITFPLIAPSLTINIVLTMIGTLKAFDLVFVMTKGGPGGATETLATLLYRTAFNQNNMGYGTAIGVVMFGFILLLALVQVRMLRARRSRISMYTSVQQTAVRWTVLLVWTTLVLIPLLVLLSIAFKTPTDMLNNPFGWPQPVVWDNVQQAWEQGNLGRSFVNSLLVTSLAIGGLVLLGSMAAYPLARRNHRWTNGVSIYFLAGIIAPFQLIMLPLYRLMRGLELINTYHGVILVYIATLLPLVVFLYTGFIKTVPRELEEAAVIDGCGPFRTFWSIVFPLLKPITASVIIVNSIFIWNDFLVSLLFLQKPERRTIPMAIFSFVGQYNSDWPIIFAAVVLASLPMIGAFLLLQRYFISGIASGAVKG